MNADDVKYIDDKFSDLYERLDDHKEDSQAFLTSLNGRVGKSETDISWIKKIGTYFAGIVSAVLGGVIVWLITT